MSDAGAGEILISEDEENIFSQQQEGGYSLLGGRTLPLDLVLKQEGVRFGEVDQLRVLEYLRAKIGDEWLMNLQAIAEATQADSSGRMRFVTDKAFEFAQMDGLNIRATFCTPTGDPSKEEIARVVQEIGNTWSEEEETVDPPGIENLPEVAHYAYREIHTLLGYMDGQKKDPLGRNKEKLSYQLKNHTIDVFSRVGYIALTTAFISGISFEPGTSRNFILELMLRSPKLKKLGVTSIDLAEAAPVSKPERVVIGCRELMPQWLVGKMVENMRGKYAVQTAIHGNKLCVGNEPFEDTLSFIDGSSRAMGLIEKGNVPGSNPALPIVTDVQLAVHRATSGKPVSA